MGNVKFESMLYSNTVNLTSISLSNLLYSEVPKRVKKVQYIAQYNARISKKEERRKEKNFWVRKISKKQNVTVVYNIDQSRSRSRKGVLYRGERRGKNN